ncbi:MAG: Trk system potassium transporter TrkA [Pseudomonadota bacterium]
MSIIIIGGGNIGFFLAKQLINEGKQVVVIEKQESRIAFLDESLDAKVICGNGAAPRVLKDAGVADAEMVISVTNSDEVNLLSSAIAGIESPSAKRIARVRNPEFDIEEAKLKSDLMIDMLINPEREAAKAMGQVLEVPGAIDLLDFFDGSIRLVGTKVLDNSDLIGKTLKEWGTLKDVQNFLLAAVFRNEELIVPTGDTRLEAKDVVYFISEPEEITSAMHHFGHEIDKIKSVMINGGGFIGLNLAKTLEKRGLKVKIVEEDKGLCSMLARGLDKSIILNARATDQEFLLEEGVDNIDAFIATTADDENNVLSSLLAKRLGVPWTVCLTHELSYLPLITTIGINVAINPRQLANNAILQYIRGGRVFSVSSLMDQAEIVEIEALHTSELVGNTLSKLKIPSGVLILSLWRSGKVMIPHGDTIIEAGDRVLLLTTRESISKLEKFVTVKLEYF